MNKFLSGLISAVFALTASAAIAADGGEKTGGLPQLNVFADGTFVGQWFWLVITFGLLFVIMWKVAVPRLEGVIESRQARIAGDLDKAQQLKAEAEKLLADYEERLSGARFQAQDVLSKARDAAAKDTADKLAALDATIAQKAADAEARIDAARAQALGELKAVATGAAVDIVNKVAGIEVADDKAADAVAKVTGA